MTSDMGQNETETDSIIILGERKADDKISSKKPKSIPPSRQASSVWNYYEKIFDDNGTTLINVICKYCGQKYSSKSSTSTLNDHLKKKHSNQLGEDTLNKSQTHVTLQEHLDYFVNWVIMDCQPFRVVDSPSFRNLIFSLNPGFKVPSRQTLRKRIDDKYEQYKDKIIKVFQENNSKVSFTSDMWTLDTGAPYMVLTAHWIDNKWNLRHTIIAFQRFPHPHTGRQIQETTSKIFQDFSLTTKAISITIDNGANQVSGMKLLKDILLNDFKVDFNIVRCGAHTVALAVSAGLKEFKPVIDKV